MDQILVKDYLKHCISKVTEFHTVFGHPIGSIVPTKISQDSSLYKLRYDLINEEFDEYIEAYTAGDRKESLDAILDISYVVAGMIVVYNLDLNDIDGMIYPDNYFITQLDPKDEIVQSTKLVSSLYQIIEDCMISHKTLFVSNIYDAFDEVHRSNMTKVCKDEEEVKATQAKYLDGGVDSVVEDSGIYFIVKRLDGKILKNKFYSAVDLTPFL